MAPARPILLVGNSIPPAPEAHTTAPTSRSPWRASFSPTKPAVTGFDRALAFRERLNATKTRAAADRVAAGHAAAPSPQAPVAPPSSRPRPAAGTSQTSQAADTLMYPVGGPRNAAQPALHASPPALPQTLAPPSLPPQLHPLPSGYVVPFPGPYEPPSLHCVPLAATPLHVPSYAAPPLHGPSSAASSSWPHTPFAKGSHGIHEGQTWPLPEISWSSPPPAAPPIPAELTSSGRATEPDIGASPSSRARASRKSTSTAPASPSSPRAPRLSTGPGPGGGVTSSSGGGGGDSMGFVSLYEREFGGRKWAQWEALRVCGVDAATRVLRAGRDAALERELQRVWRDKVAPLAATDITDEVHNVLDALHYLLLTTPSLPSLPSPTPELSSLELALLDLGIRANGLDLVGERKEVGERWRAVEGKWTARTTWVLALEDRQGELVATLKDKVDALEARCSRQEARLKELRDQVAENEGEKRELRACAERAEAKLQTKPSQRVGILLEDLDKVTASRDALSGELDTTRASLALAEAELARLRLLHSPARENRADDSPAAPENTASSGAPHPAQPQRDAEAELRRARETHDADRMIWEENTRALRAEGDELRRKLAAARAAAAPTAAAGAATADAEPGPSADGMLSVALERELKRARDEVGKKGFVVNKLAEKVKELSRELEAKARENADLLNRLVDSGQPRPS